MDSNVIGFLLSILAGFATVIGALFIIIFKNVKEKQIALILGFSAGIMLIVAFGDLLPEAITSIFKENHSLLNILYLILFVFIGILVTFGLDKLLSHHSDKDNLYHVGLITTIAISLHKFPEGIAVFIASYANVNLGLTMALAIAIHHIPEGMAIGAPIYYTTGSRLKAIKYALFSSLAEPLGALAAFLLLKPFISDFMLGSFFAVAIGIFLYIIIEELVPTSVKYIGKKMFIISLLSGIIFMSICQFFI